MMTDESIIDEIFTIADCLPCESSDALKKIIALLKENGKV